MASGKMSSMHQMFYFPHGHLWAFFNEVLHCMMLIGLLSTSRWTDVVRAVSSWRRDWPQHRRLVVTVWCRNNRDSGSGCSCTDRHMSPTTFRPLVWPRVSTGENECQLEPVACSADVHSSAVAKWTAEHRIYRALLRRKCEASWTSKIESERSSPLTALAIHWRTDGPWSSSTILSYRCRGASQLFRREGRWRSCADRQHSASFILIRSIWLHVCQIPFTDHWWRDRRHLAAARQAVHEWSHPN